LVLYIGNYIMDYKLVMYKEKNILWKIIGELQRDKKTADSLPAAKKRRIYAVTIVMQKITFQELDFRFRCVDV